FAAHGLAWVATYVKALRQMRGWAERLDEAGALREAERLILQAAFGEYLAQLEGGIALSQVEIARPADLGLDAAAVERFRRPEVARLIAAGNSAAVRQRLAALLGEGLESGDLGAAALGDPSLDLIREQFRRFGEAEIVPAAPVWHREDVLIPLAIVEKMAALGVFGLTVP